MPGDRPIEAMLNRLESLKGYVFPVTSEANTIHNLERTMIYCSLGICAHMNAIIQVLENLMNKQYIDFSEPIFGKGNDDETTEDAAGQGEGDSET